MTNLAAGAFSIKQSTLSEKQKEPLNIVCPPSDCERYALDVALFWCTVTRALDFDIKQEIADHYLNQNLEKPSASLAVLADDVKSYLKRSEEVVDVGAALGWVQKVKNEDCARTDHQFPSLVMTTPPADGAMSIKNHLMSLILHASS